MGSESPGAGLSGNYRVRALRSALSAARRLFPKTADCMELRAQALKLRYWPAKNPTDDSGVLLDVDWDWIKSLHRENVGELRIDGTIAGRDNLRLIFFVAGKQQEGEWPIIWILHAAQKKRDGFTSRELLIFRTRKRQVVLDFYGGAA